MINIDKQAEAKRCTCTLWFLIFIYTLYTYQINIQNKIKDLNAYDTCLSCMWAIINLNQSLLDDIALILLLIIINKKYVRDNWKIKTTVTMFDKIVLAFQHQKVNKIRVKRWKKWSGLWMSGSYIK